MSIDNVVVSTVTTCTLKVQIIRLMIALQEHPFHMSSFQLSCMTLLFSNCFLLPSTTSLLFPLLPPPLPSQVISRLCVALVDIML